MSRPLPLPATVPVKGTSFRQDVVIRCHVGQRVLLRRDPANPHDADAVEIVTLADQLLGYVPATLAQRLGDHPGYDGEIVEVLDGETVGLRVKVRHPLEAVEAAPAAPGDPHQVMPCGPPVYTRTGRAIGTLIRRDRHQIIVETASGPVPYPADLVRVAEPA